MSFVEIASLLRGAERLLIVGSGIVALYLGYRLFVGGLVGEQSGELTGKSFSVKLIKVGPGIFFALFGTCILVAITWQNITIPIPDKNGEPGTMSQFGSAEKSRIERAIEDLARIKIMVDKETVTKKKVGIMKALTAVQKALARTRLGNDIYQKCEHNPPEKPDRDCEIYERMIR